MFHRNTKVSESVKCTHKSLEVNTIKFHVLAIVNSVVINTGVHVSFSMDTLNVSTMHVFFNGVCPVVGLLGHMVVLFLIF